MRIEKYFTDVMAQKGFKRDKELADWLEVSAAAISQYRAGTRSMDNEKCVKVALELRIDPLQVIMATDLDKAARTGQQSLWEVFSQRMAATAATLLLASSVNLILTPGSAEASTYKPSSKAETRSLYIMSNDVSAGLAYRGQYGHG